MEYIKKLNKILVAKILTVITVTTILITGIVFGVKG
jgi:hypothetical protein